uniref:Uncharacterized protein n=1 Tax=Babesia bovis TaxID=5865 RepID=S6BHS9_BABBO|nr:hypothetical protein [Babesia bovis]
MHFPHRKMAKIPMNKHRGKGSREEVTYPGSPRSQKWVGNLLPVLEGYNYNHTEIIQLVKACDYNGEKIQQEVDRIMEINIGHEQGEWTVVKPQKVKNSPTAKGSKGTGNNFRREGNKVGYVPEVKTQRRPKNVKDTSPSVLVNQAVGIVTSSATVASTVVTPVETAVEMENFKNKREKKPIRDNQKDSSSKDGWNEVQKHPQQNSKKPFPMQWAALLKTKPEDTTIELPPGVTSPEAPPQPKQSKKPVEPKPVQQETKAVNQKENMAWMQLLLRRQRKL